MNNLFSFDEYKKEVRLNESRLFHHRNKLNEGIIFGKKWRQHKASKLVDKILKEEIELGKEFEERIKITMDELAETCGKLDGGKRKVSEFTQKVNEIITEINKVTFDALTLLGDQNIDFSGFKRSVVMANVVKLGALLSPVKNGMMIRKAYHYFIGLIKQTVRRDLVMLMINFDQFQNIIMQKSMESAESARSMQDIATAEGEIMGSYNSALKHVFQGNTKALKDLETAQKIMEKDLKQKRDLMKNDPVSSLLMNSYDNTYKTTAETIKSYIGEDNQKQLEALKTGISRLGQGDEDLSVYGELLIAAAEEKALKASNTIHNNFLKMSEVFKLTNQKKLIDLISEAEKEEQKKYKKETRDKKDKFNIKFKEEKLKFIEGEFDKIKHDLRDIKLEDIKKLKEDNVKFSFKDEKLDVDEKEEKISKYEIIETYLSIHTDELKDYSDDLRMLIYVDDADEDNYPYTYYSYIDILSDQIAKSLTRENHNDDECYIDLYKTESMEGINKILTVFNKKGKDDQKRILKYVNDDVIKINYKTLLEKLHELLDKLTGKDKREIKKYLSLKKDVEGSESVKKYQELKKWYEVYCKYKSTTSYPEKKKNAEEQYRDIADEILSDEDIAKKLGLENNKVDNFTSTKNPLNPPVKLKIKISSDSYKEWKDSFEEMKKYKNNDYKK